MIRGDTFTFNVYLTNVDKFFSISIYKKNINDFLQSIIFLNYDLYEVSLGQMFLRNNRLINFKKEYYFDFENLMFTLIFNCFNFKDVNKLSIEDFIIMLLMELFSFFKGLIYKVDLYYNNTLVKRVIN